MAAALRSAGSPVREVVGRSGLNFGFAAWRELLPQCLSTWL